MTAAPTFCALQAGDASDASAVLEAILADAAPTVAGRPRTIGVMVASVDGHATLEGRSGGLGSPEDREVFRGLRSRADALLVGPGTLNHERYATVLDPPHRAARKARGQTPEPLVATVSRSFSLDQDVPLLHEPLGRTVVYTESTPPFTPDPERVEIARVLTATPATALTDLHRRGVRLVNCEGGPTLLAALVLDELLDELLLTVSPLLVGGTDPLTILRGAVSAAGDPDDPTEPGTPVPLTLRGVWRGGDALFLHYHLIPRSPA